MQKGRLHSVILFFTAFMAAGSSLSAQTIVASQPATNTYLLGNASICVDVNDDATVQLAASFLQQDLDCFSVRARNILQTLSKRNRSRVEINRLLGAALIG